MKTKLNFIARVSKLHSDKLSRWSDLPHSKNLCAAFLVAITLLLLAFSTRAQSIYTPYTFTNFAGQPGGPGVADSTGVGARFRNPAAVASDSSGNIFVADQANFTIRKITPAGVVTTFAGSPSGIGTNDGVGAAAKFGSVFGGPTGIAVDMASNVYVADTFNNTIRKITPGASVSTFAGSGGLSGTNDATGNAARFSGPQGVATDSSGNIYVADSGNSTVRKITPAGAVTTIAGTPGHNGSLDATNTATLFGPSGPIGIAVDSNTNIYLTDVGNYTVRRLSPVGTNWVASTLAGFTGSIGFSDGTNQSVTFDNIIGIAVDSVTNIYVTDQAAQTIRKLVLIGTNCVVSTPAGTVFASGHADGTGGAVQFQGPRGATVDSAGNLYVADSGNDLIRKLTPAGTNLTSTTFAGRAGGPGTADGLGSAAQFDFPQGVALDAAGNLYVADNQNHTIRKVTPAGLVTTIAGVPGNQGYADGDASGAPQFNSPVGLCIDSQSNLYVVDTANQNVRKVTPAAVVTTVAGVATVPGLSNGPVSSALFNQPSGAAVDSAGNIYVADTVNRILRKISNGFVTNFAGIAKTIGTNDGPVGVGQFSAPGGLAVDAAGNVYVVDSAAIRKVAPDGTISTLAGGKSGTNDGLGGLAQFSNPQDITVDASGNLYVSDLGNNIIRKVTPAGLVTTIAGAAKQNGIVDGTNGAAHFSAIRGIGVDSATNIFVNDATTVRKITPVGTNWVVTTLAGTNFQATVDGTNGVARFRGLYGMAVDGAGNIFSLDRNDEMIRKITPAGVVTSFVGTRGTPGSADGTGVEALFDQPSSICVDSATNIYVGEAINCTVRKISLVGTNWMVTTLAGDATVSGTNDAVGKAALFGQVHGVAVDSAHNVYVADLQHQTIRKITPGGAVTTFAGAPGQAGLVDATGTAARFVDPTGITSDGVNLFVTDGIEIRSVSSGAVVKTIAGCPTGGCTNAQGSADGPGFTARFGAPVGIAVDASGNLYVADEGNDIIRKLTGSGTNWNVTTLGGLPGAATYVDGTGINARFNNPTGVAVDAAGNVYVGDTAENHIAKGFLAAAASPVIEFDTSPGGLVISTGQLQMRFTNVPSSGNLTLQTSTNLMTWTPVRSNALTGANVIFSVPFSPNTNRFFRAVLGP